VCEQWNVLAKDVVLWKTLSYKCDSSSDISHIAEASGTEDILLLQNVRHRVAGGNWVTAGTYIFASHWGVAI